MQITKPTLLAVKTITAPDASLGSLSVIQANSDLGFPIKRIYYIHGMSVETQRGGHAHKTLYQCITAVSGSVTITLEGREGVFTHVLDSPAQSLLIPPGYWRDMAEFSKGTVLLVLASADYDQDDYIRDKAHFEKWLENREPSPESVPYLDLAARHGLLAAEIDHDAKRLLAEAHYILGPNVDRFEKEFAEYCGVNHCIGTGNGLDALELIVRAYGIGKGDEVLIAASGFIATPLSIFRAGATPVFVESKNDGNLNPELIENAITPRTKAIMLTHLFGIPAEMDAINRIAAKHGLYVFEDSCQAHGAEFRGKKCGGLGHAAAFSFYPSKNLGAFGDGGCITTNDEAIAARIRQLHNYGSKVKYHHDLMGFNSRLDDLQAGLLSGMLPYLDGWNEKRRMLAEIYFDRLSGIENLRLPEYAGHVVPNWHIFPVFVKEGLRDALAEHLRSNGIGTNIHYPVPMHLQPCCEDLGYAKGAFPITERLCAEELSLPLDPFKTERHIEKAVDVILNFPLWR